MRKTKPKKTIKAGWINKKEMAASCGITPQGFDGWGVTPVDRIGRQVFFTVASVLENRIKHSANRSNKKPDDEKSAGDIMATARLDKLVQETRKLRLQNSILEGISLPAWVVTEILTKVLSQSASIFDSLSANIHRKHPEIDKRIIDSIEADVIKHMNEVARLDEYIEKALDDIVREAESSIN